MTLKCSQHLFSGVVATLPSFTMQEKLVKDSGVVRKFYFLPVARLYPAVGKIRPRPESLTNFRTGSKGTSTEFVKFYPTSPEKPDFYQQTPKVLPIPTVIVTALLFASVYGHLSYIFLLMRTPQPCTIVAALCLTCSVDNIFKFFAAGTVDRGSLAAPARLL